MRYPAADNGVEGYGKETMTIVPDVNDTKPIKRLLGPNVKFNELMSKHTSLRVGGPADIFALPENIRQLTELIGWAGRNQIPCLVLGGGTNLLVKDNGIRGVVISLSKCLNEIKKTDAHKGAIRVTAMAGVSLKSLCRFSLNNALSGMNFALGIPGSVGGAITMNAGTVHGAMADVLEAVEILLPDGDRQTIGKHRLQFGYRHLSFKNIDFEKGHGRPVILSGSFILSRTNKAGLKHDAIAILRNRKQKQPIGWASAGCFFKNPSSAKPAGWLIEQAGLKGKKKGQAKISTKHANFILNTGQASATDILWLMEYAREKVFQRFGITLEPEVKIVGD